MNRTKNTWNKLADKATVEKTVASLLANEIEASFVATGTDAKAKALSLIPEGKEVMTMTSTSTDTIGLSKELNESGRFDSARAKLAKMDRDTQGKEMRKLSATPDFVVGSVHAVTENGQILVASQSGSQIPAYAYGSAHVIWIVGTHKIVKNIAEGMKRIYEHSLPLEDQRAKKAYGVGSSVAKILIINKEKVIGRLHLIFVNEVLGF